MYFSNFLRYRGFISFTLGLYDTDQVREQFSDAKQITEHSEFSISQRIESGGTTRYAVEYFRQDHSIHRAGATGLCDA